jgi:integrase
MAENLVRDRGRGMIYGRPSMEPGGVYWIQYYDRGVKVRKSTKIEIPADPELRKSAEKKVEKRLRKAIGEVEAGVHPETRRINYEDLRASYYTDYDTNRRKSLRRDADGKPYLDKVSRLDSFFSGFQASEIDADMIRKFSANQQAKGLSSGTINRSISALRRMFNLAKIDGKLRYVPHFPMLKESAPRQGFFERAQYDSLLAAMPDYLQLTLALGYFTGMRKGEILSLKWEQIDFPANSIMLRAGETKNDAARTVPIVPQLRPLLIEQRARRRADCPYVCYRIENDRAVRIGSFRKVWESRCAKLGLGRFEPVTDKLGAALYSRPRGPRSKAKPKMTYQGMIFHDLRRTAVRNLVRAGVPERVAQTISGHKTRSVFERYNIVSPADVAEAGRKLATYHNEIPVGHNSGTMEPQENQPQSLIQ